jgi:hypothetical protein
MKALLPLSLLPLLAALFSQSHALPRCSNFILGRFDAGVTAHSFADRVNVRREASTGGAVVAALKLGAPVEILDRGRDEDALELRGLRECWYKVRGEAELLSSGSRGTAKGWVWGGLLAKVALSFDFDRDGTNELLLVGLVSNQANAWGKAAEARVVMGGKITRRFTFIVFDAATNRFPRQTLWGDVFQGSGLEPVPLFLRLGFDEPTGGAPSGQWLFLLDGGPLAPALGAFGRASSPDDPGYRILFPDQLYGVAGRIAVESLPFESLSSTHWASAKTERAHHAWDGQNFRKDP